MADRIYPNRILGIDPGLNTTGYAVIDTDGQQVALIEAGVVRSTRSKSFEQRLQQIFDGVADVIQSLSPDLMSLEEVYSHYERPQTAILMGHARGVINLAAAQNNLVVNSYSATQVKSQLTGNGRAPKHQVQLSVVQHLSLEEVPSPDDVADAMAIALCHTFIQRSQLSQQTN